MSLTLYNTLAGKKEVFKSIEPKIVKMYVCGPTVYDYDHVGHARTYLSFDLLHRFLRFLGYKVVYVQNITDVGHMVNDAETGLDKIKKKAQETGESVADIVRHFTEAHRRDMESLNILKPTHQPKASAHIEEIIAFIEGLIEKGYAYVTEEKNVYFSVSRKPDYGKLSHRGIAEMITGSRVEPAKDKRSPADFALWKAAPFGATEMVWDSPWGQGYPGWHIECSTMSRKYLGDTFDIHGSAVEHVFPHHENEIAQSEALTGQELAHYWVHAGMLTVNGAKMSKSLRNTVSVREALKEYSANELRLAFYLTHYRRPFDYTKEVLAQGMTLRKKLFTAFLTSKNEAGDKEVFNEVIAVLSDDLNTPEALRLISENITSFAQDQLKKLFEIFGLVFNDIASSDSALKLAEERAIARDREDFLTADNRKAEIEQLGFEAIDQDDKSIYVPR